MAAPAHNTRSWVRFIGRPLALGLVIFGAVTFLFGVNTRVGAPWEMGVTSLLAGMIALWTLGRWGGSAPAAADSTPVCPMCQCPQQPGSGAAPCPQCGHRVQFVPTPLSKSGAVVVLAECRTDSEAVMIAAAVRDEGIQAELEGATVAGLRAEAPGVVRVMVARADHARAAAVVDEVRKSAASIDWSQVDVGEPVDPDDKPTA